MICDACYTLVPAGLLYRRDVWKDGTYHWAIRYCPDCWRILHHVWNYTHPDYGGPTAEHYEIWAHAQTHGPMKDTADAWQKRAFPER